MASIEDLINKVAYSAPGASVDVDVIRDGKPIVLNIVIAERPQRLR